MLKKALLIGSAFTILLDYYVEKRYNIPTALTVKNRKREKNFP